MINYRKIIPTRLKYLRDKYSFTQCFVAEQLEIGQSTYANWEAGRKMPSIEAVAQLADLYETSVDLLLGRTDINSHTK